LQQQHLCQLVVNRFIGIAGVYDIPTHYQFESGRGVERISPLAPACGGSLAAWRRQSPTYLIAQQQRCNDVVGLLPPTLLCHGALDSTVPYTSSVGFFKAFDDHDRCRLEILPETEHAETVMHLMFGGKTRDVVMDWIHKKQDEADL
jgi:hypothetical protein